MKKLLTFALALVMVLSMSVTAFASNITQDSDPKTADTNVNFSVDPTYTVTIPAAVVLAKDSTTGNYKQDATIAAENVRLLENKVIKVTLASDFKLTTGVSGANYELPYTVTVGNDTTAITTGAPVATFTTTTANQSSVLHFAADNPTYAGDYKDTVTFTISVE